MYILYLILSLVRFHFYYYYYYFVNYWTSSVCLLFPQNKIFNSFTSCVLLSCLVLQAVRSRSGSYMQVHPHSGPGQRVSRWTGFWRRVCPPGTGPRRTPMELPGPWSQGTGPGVQHALQTPAKPGVHGVPVQSVRRRPGDGARLPQLGE